MGYPRRIAFCFAAFLVVFFCVTTVYSEERRWEDTAELSYVQTGGNTDVLTFSGSNALKYHFSESWDGAWKIGGLYGESDGVQNAERYFTDLRLDYKSTDRLFYYGSGGWRREKFSGLDNRYVLGFGSGYKVLTGGRHVLLFEAGINYAFEAYADDTESEFMEGRLFGNYEYTFNSKTLFSQTLECLYNFEDARYKLTAVTALKTLLSDIFSLKVAYEIDYDSQPVPESLEKTDTIFSVALVVSL